MDNIIKKYFEAWLNADVEPIKEIFAENCVYSECFGPEYRGVSQIIRWFEDWNARGRVLEWTIKRTIKQDKTLVAEWHFKCEIDGKIDDFDGVTIADFDDDNQISKLCEFQSKTEHNYPYEE